MEEIKDQTMATDYKTFPVKIRVISQKGLCVLCHKVGDEWIYKYEPGKRPETPDICDGALHAMSIYLRPLCWGATIPFPMRDPDTLSVACPDPDNTVVFELKRLREQPIYHSYGDRIFS